MTDEQYCLSGKSLNKDWTRGIARVRHIPVQHANRKNGRAKSAVSLRSASADFLAETDDDEISDTMKEFKLTLQLFKRLTQQVRDVNQCMNQQRIYSFKHHMNNEGIASPALRRSQLAAAMSKREIPATEAPYEPCNDLGPACTYLTRPCSRQERATHSPSPMSRPSSSAAPSRSSSPSPNVRPSSRSSAKRTAEKAAELKKLEEELTKADAEAREAWEESDPHYDELFVAEELSLEDLEFRFHDPYPDTWVDEVVEDACFRGTKKTDPFMLRLSEFETLEEETVLWEKYREEKARQIADAAKGSNYKSTRQSGVSHINSRTQSAKISAPHLYRAKTGVNRLKRSSSAGKGSASNAAISASDEGSDSVQTFRNSGYKMGVSFIAGSLYPEARPQKTSSKNADNVSKNVRSASPSAHVQKSPSPKPPSCEACYSKTTAGQKAAGASPRPIALSAHALRSQYELKASECYDIVELARTFDPPCKAQFVKAKAKSRASSADNALIKGITPGKSYFSQRRVSLTRLVPDESMSVRGIGAQNSATRPSTGRCKSAKKGLKRR